MNKELSFIVKKTLTKETNTLLTELERLMAEEGMREVMNREGAPGRTQFNAIMQASLKASCVEELLLFIAYQGSKGEKTVAQAVTQSIIKECEDIANKIYKELGGGVEITKDDERIIQLEIAKKYLGYLYWKTTIERSR